MRRVCFFLAAAVTFYIAGMFQQLPVLILFLAEMALAVILFVQSRVRASQLKGGFSVKSMSVQKGELCRCGLKIQSRAAVPAVLRALVQIPWYEGKEKRFSLQIQQEDGHSFFSLVPERCGLLEVRLRQLCVQDSLGLFSGRRRCEDLLRIAVLPQPGTMHLSARPAGARSFPEERDKTPRQRGDHAQEVRQLHEYRPGDLVRYVHWKQSARSGTLLIKEFEGESTPELTVFLDFSDADGKSAEELQCFYTVLDALVRGLLAAQLQVSVLWRRDGQEMSCLVQEEDDVQLMFWRLFLSRPEESGHRGKAGPDASGRDGAEPAGSPAGVLPEETQADMRLTWDGRWYSEGRLIWKFSESEYEKEIETRDFSVL